MSEKQEIILELESENNFQNSYYFEDLLNRMEKVQKLHPTYIDFFFEFSGDGYNKFIKVYGTRWETSEETHSRELAAKESKKQQCLNLARQYAEEYGYKLEPK